MLLEGTTNARSLLWQHRFHVLAVIAIVIGVEILNDFVDLRRPSLSMAAVGLLVTALSIFLVFRVNEAYTRWWEARILWGGIVNQSRNFARQVATMLSSDDPDEARPVAWKRELVHRQIAWINALRLSLRGESRWESLSDLVPEGEMARIEKAPNVPTTLLQIQGQRIADARAEGLLDVFRQVRLENTLSELCNLQGGCERIRNTVFPDAVAFFTQHTAWFISILIAICISDPDNRFDFVDVFVVPTMMLAFIITERLGADLKNPFRSRPNDTPMTALCRTIEIDLRALLEEEDLPRPVEAVDGVLL